jgi:hypothetical protein
MVPLAFITKPAFGLVPGVKLTLVPITAGTPLVVSLPITETVAPPVEGMGAGVSFTAVMVGATVITILAVLQVAGEVAGKIQIW